MTNENDLWKIYFFISNELIIRPSSLLKYLFKHFRKLIHAFAADDPTRRQQRTGGEALA